jgi:hypothetical protein
MNVKGMGTVRTEVECGGSEMARWWLRCQVLGAAVASLPGARRGGGFVALCSARRWLRCPVLGSAVASLPCARRGGGFVAVGRRIDCTRVPRIESG